MHWRLFVELLVRSAAVLLAAELARLLSRRRSAAFRHRLLLWALLLLALLPALSMVLPAIPLMRWPMAQERATVSVHQVSMFALTGAAENRSVEWGLYVWLAGVVAALAPLAFGVIAAHRLKRRAVRLDDRAWNALLRQLLTRGRHSALPALFLSRDLRIPFLCGFFHPCILLPHAALNWSAARRRSVLSHELAHLQRHDLSSQLAAHVIAALWWFQPLVWFTRSALRTESELACDAAALASGLRPSDYAAELLAIAQDVRLTPLGVAAMGIARRRGLEARIRSILTPLPATLSSPFRTLAVLALLSCIAFGASTLTGNSTSTRPGGRYMKRSLFSALLVSAGLSAATVSGSLSDQSGAAIGSAKVLLSNAKTGEQQQSMSGPDGRFDLANAPAGAYVLHVEKPGFGSILRAFNLQDDSKLDVGYTMANGAAAAALNKLESTDVKSKPVRVGGAVEESNLITKVQPVYPAAAKSTHTQGAVELEAVISKEGVPLEIRVSSSPSDDLSESALEAVSQWRYRPVLLNGNPVEVVTEVLVNYTLSQ